MTPLIAKLEAATGPSRELDAEIDCAVRFPDLRPARPDDHKEHQRGYPPSAGDIWCPTGFLMASSYTSSFDAILTLARTQGDAFKIVDAAANAETFRGRMAALNRTPLDLWPVRKAALLAALRARDGGRG